jgi:prepilin-type N-terminal cleavage/methylation domain-containing protein
MDQGCDMLTRARALLREDDGFSLMELLVAMAIGSIVLTAVMVVFTNGMTGTARVTDRIDASARARLTTDTISSLLQAGVCNTNTPPITNATANSVTFTGNLGNADASATQYRIRWDSSTKTVYEDIYTSNGQASDLTLTYPAVPTSTRVIGVNMQPQGDQTTLFAYYPFDTTTGTVAANPVTAPGTNATALRSIVAVTTSLMALPSRTKTSSTTSAAPIEAQSVIGQVDPSNPGQGTQC